jgi:hypothetical protein
MLRVIKDLGVHLHLGAEHVQEVTGAPMEADNFAHRCRELKRRTFLCPIWPECAPVADQSEGSQTVPAFAIAYAPFHVDEVLILLQRDLEMPKIQPVIQ